MKSFMQHKTALARAAWLPLVLGSGACSMDLPLGDMPRDEPDWVDDGASAAVPSTVDGALAPALLPPDVTFGMGEQLWGYEPVVGADLDADGHDDLVVSGRDVATGVQLLHIRYGGARPGDAGEALAFAESGARLLAAETTLDPLFAAGDVNGDGYADLFAADVICQGPEPAHGGYLIYGGPQRLDGVIDLASVSTRFTPPVGTGDASSCSGHLAMAPGDLDGDGLSDLVFVYPRAAEFSSFAGELPTVASGVPGIYVFYGKREGFGPNVSWTSADARISSALSGDPRREWDSISVHAVGDQTGDGRAEFVINYVPEGELLPTTDGSVVRVTEQILVPGGERLPSSVDLTALPLRIPGTFTQHSLKALGDLDGDGTDDIVTRFGNDYMLFYGAPDLLDAPLDPARAAARLLTGYDGMARPLGDLDGDGDAELGLGRYLPGRPWVAMLDMVVLSGTAARWIGDVTFPKASEAGARIYPPDAYGDTRVLLHIAPVGDLDGDGVGDVLTQSSIDVDVGGNPLPMLHLHYGKRAEPTNTSNPR